MLFLKVSGVLLCFVLKWFQSRDYLRVSYPTRSVVRGSDAYIAELEADCLICDPQKKHGVVRVIARRVTVPIPSQLVAYARRFSALSSGLILDQSVDLMLDAMGLVFSLLSHDTNRRNSDGGGSFLY